MIRTAALLAPLLLVACARGTDPSASASLDNSEEQQLQRSLDETTLAVRLKAAEARIVELERQVGTLQATPEKLDLQLLTQRVEQLEARVYARGADEGVPAAAGPPSRAADATPKPVPSPTPPANRFNPFGL